MIYILRTLWVLFYIPIFLLECIAFILGIFISPFVDSITYIKTGEYGNYYAAMMAEYIEKEYGKLKDKIEKLK